VDGVLVGATSSLWPNFRGKQKFKFINRLALQYNWYWPVPFYFAEYGDQGNLFSNLWGMWTGNHPEEDKKLFQSPLLTGYIQRTML